jgi:CRP/FNR family transcriptional regulator, anaerobic regulatory protein
MNHIPIVDTSSKCSTCLLGSFCLPVGLSVEDAAKVDTLVTERLRLKKGETLYRQGDTLQAVYGLRSGTLKTQTALSDGREQITGFHLPGEIVGLDGIGDLHYQSTSLALEDTEVCAIPMADLESMARLLPSLQQQFHRILSREITQDHNHLLSLGSMRSEERLANFILNLAQRYSLRGYSGQEFNLRMSRDDIGSYLGMQIETVSRLFSRFSETGMVQINVRHIKILDVEGLNEIAGNKPHC